MKKLSFLALAAVGLLFGACASNDAVDEKENLPSLDGKGQGFLNVGINLPTQPQVSTRAWAEDEQLDDGLADEYAVDDVLLVVFGGDADETNATVQQVVSPSANPWTSVGTTTDQVTTKKNYVFQLAKSATGPFYIMAILNCNGIVTKASDTELKVNGTTVSKIGDLQNALVTATKNGDEKFINASGHFFMTNAVLSTKQGGTVAPTGATTYILSPVTKIFDSEDAANSEAGNKAPSADVYVERAMAKVTLGASALKFDAGISVKSGSLPTPELSAWTLDNTNLSSYVVRQVPTEGTGFKWDFLNGGSPATDKYRFIGQNSVDQVSPTVTTAFRTYWAVDPNYNIAYNKANFYEPATKDFTKDKSKPQYCYENTFTVPYQSYQNTTRVVVKIDINGSSTDDFYTLGTDRKTIYSGNDVKSEFLARLILDINFQKWFAAKSTATLDASCFSSVEWNDETKTGLVKVKEISILKSKLTTPPSEDVKLTSIDETIGGVTIKGTDILADISTLVGKVTRFVGGATYYSLRIKHFGDDLTPWGWNGEKESTIATIYPGLEGPQAENYLGRYGMVRNNWYYLELKDILKIGAPYVPRINPDNPDPDPDDPDDPEDPEHPDDSLDDTFINARINILSWAKRPQNWNLK